MFVFYPRLANIFFWYGLQGNKVTLLWIIFALNFSSIAEL